MARCMLDRVVVVYSCLVGVFPCWLSGRFECLTLGKPVCFEKFSPKTKLISVSNPNHQFEIYKLEPNGLTFDESSILRVFKCGLEMTGLVIETLPSLSSFGVR